ncbi:CHAD domain-containing protein [Synechococcus sp. RSCCF101]|uniref:CHAD domain-containing protein n=1 Tax=Synechococcus sp. RSCCF101 TaxID=2511069 RepID=UPI0012471038|nr:CHAD domain-containing protein [Synechococcus sp. RSCCF101]QEY33021.1 CHAD domain-containing protein [Synechococcus sp. RSCCF101]
MGASCGKSAGTLPEAGESHRALIRLLERRHALLAERLNGLMPELLAPPPKTAESEQLEADRHAVHQFRTSLRRLRSMAEAFPNHWHWAGASRLGRMARLAGAVRDLDVLLEELETCRTTNGTAMADAERSRLDRLLRTLGKRRRRARRRLARHLQRPPAWWSRLLQSDTTPTMPGDLAPSVPLLQAALMAQMARIRLASGWGDGQRPAPGSPEELALHELRKAFKRLRYQLEMWEAVRPDLRDRLLRLKRVQDALGTLQDLVIWKELLEGSQGQRADPRPLASRCPTLIGLWQERLDLAWADWCDQRHLWLETDSGFPEWWRWCLQNPGGVATLQP